MFIVIGKVRVDIEHSLAGDGRSGACYIHSLSGFHGSEEIFQAFVEKVEINPYCQIRMFVRCVAQLSAKPYFLQIIVLTETLILTVGA
ncbi:MAG: hypothetical protein JWO06_1571 [Bacteroidota bacterium]|nr:hypothetical protein [Bacteroidota bacterium]